MSNWDIPAMLSHGEEESSLYRTQSTYSVNKLPSFVNSFVGMQWGSAAEICSEGTVKESQTLNWTFVNFRIK